MKHAILALVISIIPWLLFPAFDAMAIEPAVISFTPPTKYTDGSDIPAGTAISYNIYQAKRGDALAKVATITTTGTTISTGLVPGVEYCFAASAVIATVEGPQSAAVCKLTPALVPAQFVITVK